MSDVAVPSVKIVFPLRPNKGRGVRTCSVTVYCKDKLAAVIQVDERAKPTTKVYTRRYACLEVPVPRDRTRRVFKLSKPMAFGREPYHVEVRADGVLCDCRAGLKAGGCVHAEAVAGLLAQLS